MPRQRQEGEADRQMCTYCTFKIQIILYLWTWNRNFRKLKQQRNQIPCFQLPRLIDKLCLSATKKKFTLLMLRKYFETAMKIRGNSVNYFHSFLPIRFPQADSDKRMHRKDAIKLGNCLWKFGCIIQIMSYKVTWWHGDNGHIHHHRHH